MKSKVWIYWKQQGYPFFHGSVDSAQWQTIPMQYKGRNLFELQFQFHAFLRFVFCNQEKSKWFNPHRQLSQTETFINQNNDTNFIINAEGEYIVINCILTKVNTSDSLDKKLVVINVDGVLVGDELSLHFFNSLWMARFYLSNKNVLVYTTGRSLDDVMKLGTIILPQFLICQGGSYVYKINNQLPGNTFYQLLQKNYLSLQQTERLLSLQELGFKKANQNRNNSYVILKKQLILNNKDISKLLQTLPFSYNMVEQTLLVYFDFTPFGIDKSKALQTVKNITKIKKVIAFGSNLNDFTVLYNADICVIPVNGNRKLKHLLASKKFIQAEGQLAQSLVQYFQGILN